MKFLKKTSLAAAIAVASMSAHAGMVALDDDMLSGVTGQSGVTIEIGLQAGTGANAAIKVGGIDYKDDGHVNINDLWVGSDNGVTITQTIDVLANGQLQMGVSNVNGLQVGIGSVHLANAANTAVGDALASNVKLNLDIGQTNTLIGARSTFAANSVAAGVADNAATGISDNTMFISAETSIKLNSGEFEALGGNVKVSGLTFSDDGNNATVKQTIYADTRGVNIILEEIKGDLAIGSIVLGNNGHSIGSVIVSDIVMAGVTTTIYGHQ